MVYIQNNAVNQVWLGINEWATLSNPTYLFQLENSQGRDSVYFIPRNITANYPDSYANKYLVFEFETFLGNPIQLRATGATDCNIHLKNENQYWLYIWEQPQGDGNLNPLNATNKVFNELAFIFVDENNTYYTGNTANFADNVIYYSQGTTPPPSPSPSSTPPSPTSSPTPTPSITPTITPTLTNTPTITPTLTNTPTITPSVSPAGLFCVGSGFDTTSRVVGYFNNSIYAGGDFEFYQGSRAPMMVRIDENTGQYNTNFYSSIPFTLSTPTIFVSGFAPLTNGKFFATGFWSFGVNSIFNQTNLFNSDGSVDSSFQINPNEVSNSSDILVNSAETYVMVSRALAGATTGRVMKYDFTGAVDTSFTGGTNFNNNVECLAYDDSENIFVGGAFTQYKSIVRNRFVKIDQYGTLNTTFQTGMGTGFGNGSVRDSLYLSGSVYCVGTFSLFNGAGKGRIVKLDSNTGILDATFNSNSGFGVQGTTALIESIAYNHIGDYLLITISQANGANGLFNNNPFYGRIIALNTDGTIYSAHPCWNDPNYGFDDLNIGADIGANSISVLPNGDMVLVGQFNSFSGQYMSRLVKLDYQGNLISTSNCFFPQKSPTPTSSMTPTPSPSNP